MRKRKKIAVMKIIGRHDHSKGFFTRILTCMQQIEQDFEFLVRVGGVTAFFF